MVSAVETDVATVLTDSTRMVTPPSSTQNLQQLRALRPSIVIGDITERTHRGTLVWNRLPGLIYEAIDDEYDFRLFNNGNQFVLDIFKNGILRLTMLSSVIPDVKGLYTDVGIFTRLPGENQVRKLLKAVLTETTRVLPEFPCLGGIEVGGTSIANVAIQSTGGCVIDGDSPVQNFYPGHGGYIVDGTADVECTYNVRGIGGGVIDRPQNIKSITLSLGGSAPLPDNCPPVNWLFLQGMDHMEGTRQVGGLPTDFFMWITLQVHIYDPFATIGGTSPGAGASAGAAIITQGDLSVFLAGGATTYHDPGSQTIIFGFFEDVNNYIGWTQGLYFYYAANYPNSNPTFDQDVVIGPITGTYLSTDV